VRMKSACCILAILLPSLAMTAQTAAVVLAGARSLKCQFDRGTSTEWVEGIAKSSAANESQAIQFDSIDSKKGRARIIGNFGANDVAVLVTGIGLTFVEQGDALFDATTVFPIYAKNGDFIAVDHRAVQVLGHPLAELALRGGLRRRDGANYRGRIVELTSKQREVFLACAGR